MMNLMHPKCARELMRDKNGEIKCSNRQVRDITINVQLKRRAKTPSSSLMFMHFTVFFFFWPIMHFTSFAGDSMFKSGSPMKTLKLCRDQTHRARPDHILVQVIGPRKWLLFFSRQARPDQFAHCNVMPVMPRLHRAHELSLSLTTQFTIYWLNSTNTGMRHVTQYTDMLFLKK